MEKVTMASEFLSFRMKFQALDPRKLLAQSKLTGFSKYIRKKSCQALGISIPSLLPMGAKNLAHNQTPSAFWFGAH
jgi:hypothetical protein